MSLLTIINELKVKAMTHSPLELCSMSRLAVKQQNQFCLSQFIKLLRDMREVFVYFFLLCKRLASSRLQSEQTWAWLLLDFQDN